MRILSNDGRPVSDRASVVYAHCTVDLTAGAIAFTDIPCRNLEVVLGGFSQSFQILATRDITDALSPANPLVVDTSALTSTNVMTDTADALLRLQPAQDVEQGSSGGDLVGGHRKVRIEAEAGERRRDHLRGQGRATDASRDSGVTHWSHRDARAGRRPAGTSIATRRSSRCTSAIAMAISL